MSHQAVLLAVLIAGTPAMARDSAPVPLHRVEPQSPPETVGSGLAPAVSVRVKVDTRGRVASVEIVDIKPSSPFDAQYAESARQALSLWRFAPALKNGESVETSFEWTIQYTPLVAETHDTAEGVPRRGWRLSLEDEERADLQRWTRYLGGLDGPTLQKLLDERSRRADALLGKDQRSESRTDHFLVRTDAPTAGLATTIGSNLEACYGVIARLLSGKILPQPSFRRVHVYAYRSRSAFRELLQQIHGWDKHEGFYDPVGLLAFHMEMGANEALRAMIMHEAVHAFLHDHVARSGVLLPLWLNEGFADYIANSEIKGGTLVPGKHRVRQTYHAPGAAWYGRSQAQLGVDDVKKALRTGSAIPLSDLVAAKPVEFYGDRYRFFYTQSWLLVHFLRHGRPDWADESFPLFLLYVAEGVDPPVAFREVYGAEPTSLEAEFRKYIAQF